ncbi:MAG: diguanylate cyclase [bacterium]
MVLHKRDLKSKFLSFFLSFILASVILLLSGTDLLTHLKLNSLDFLFHLKGPSAYNPHIIIVEIDDENISKIGRWPWRRSWHAGMIEALNSLGTKYILFDILFSEASSEFEEDDDVFSESIKKAGNVYLPFAFQDQSNIDIEKALLPLEKFSSYTRAILPITISLDMDGRVRSIPLFFEGKRGHYPHMALKIAMDYSGLKIDQITPDYLFLSNPEEEIKIPLIEGNKMLINWLGKWNQTFQHYSFVEVLKAYQDISENKTPAIDLTPFKDSICLVAVTTAIGVSDIKPTPLEPQYPSVGLLATTISNVLDKKFMRVSPVWISWLLIYILALIPPLSLSGKRPVREAFSIMSVGVGSFITDFLFFKRGVWIDFSLPLLSLLGSYLGVATYNFIRISLEKQHFFELAVTDELTNLYNIRHFKAVLHTECLMARGDPDKRFCVVMTDIDHFKRFNDTYGHQVGDLVLKEVGKASKASVRSSDVVARYGGEEMIILLRGSALKDGLLVAEKIRKNVEKHLVADENNTYKVTISLGVSTFGLQDNEETIIKRADRGLYQAKDSGRNRVETVEGNGV